MAVGCGETDGEPTEIDRAQFSDDLCTVDGLQVLGAIEPAEAVDYVELRRLEQWGPDDEQPPSIIDASGEQCAGASDVAACEAAFMALPASSEFVVSSFDSNVYRSLAYRRMDDVQAVVDRAQLASFLGQIDSPGDAALWAVLTGRRMVCGEDNDVGSHPEGFVIHTSTGDGCPNDIERHAVLIRPDGTSEVLNTVLFEQGDPDCSVGRLPAGLCRSVRPRQGSPVGDFLAEVAHLEAAAVTAFDQLAQELSEHGAPSSMVRAAKVARRDEVRHARVMARHARRYGGRPVAPRVRDWSPRDLESVAIDNAAEGCIRETYGALVAHAQARRARDPELRTALVGIARDETRHAALSWSLHAWASERMSAVQRRRVRAAGAEALERLGNDLTRGEHEDVQRMAGMPGPAQAQAMFAGLRRAMLQDGLA